MYAHKTCTLHGWLLNVHYIVDILKLDMTLSSCMSAIMITVSLLVSYTYQLAVLTLLTSFQQT